MTNNPQIISTSSLAAFNPHHAFTQSGGTTFDFIQEQDHYIDQLAGFKFFLPPEACKEPFSGTIIHPPLHTDTAILAESKMSLWKLIRYTNYSRISKTMSSLYLCMLCIFNFLSVYSHEHNHSASQCLDMTNEDLKNGEAFQIYQCTNNNSVTVTLSCKCNWNRMVPPIYILNYLALFRLFLLRLNLQSTWNSACHKEYLGFRLQSALFSSRKPHPLHPKGWVRHIQFFPLVLKSPTYLQVAQNVTRISNSPFLSHCLEQELCFTSAASVARRSHRICSIPIKSLEVAQMLTSQDPTLDHRNHSHRHRRGRVGR